MTSPITDEHTRREWRELGFFYDLNPETKEWRVVGTRAGIERFGELLVRYASDPRNARPSEHEHYGPYMYLKVMTWPDPGISQNSIHGSIADLRGLGELIARHARDSAPGARIRIAEQFAKDLEYGLVLDIRDDSFDPALEDPALSPTAG
jgi:hypothetical protein